MTLLLLALALMTGGGVAALLTSRWAGLASALAVAGVVGGAGAGEVYAFRVLLGGDGGDLTLAWNIPYAEIHVAADPLSAFFLVPVFGLAALAAIYGREYLGGQAGAKPLGLAWLAFNLLVASMVVVVVARQAVLFLVAWEAMSLSAYLLVTFEHEHAEVRRAGFVYLIAAHVGTAFLIALFLILGREAHSFDFEAMQKTELADTALSTVLFGMGMVGFGVKAGFIPLHVWLPEAHAAAPSHVSALMSGVLIKMGLYGLLRILLIIGRPAAFWGPVLIVVGLGGAIIGIALALQQRDIKRVLAYSSIENMGLITLGLGTGFWGVTSGRPLVAYLGTLGALLHVWNHALMKGLLFLGAGSVLHGCGTKDMELLGGVVKRMPRTAAAMVFGAVAIAGLPPLNGFVSEWLLYLALIEGALGDVNIGGVAALFVVGGIALVGGLAVLCFVRLVGIALLGEPRGPAVPHAHESGFSMTGSMALLAAISIAVAIVPSVLVAASARVVAQLSGADASVSDAPVATIGKLNGVLCAALVTAAVIWAVVNRKRAVGSDATWGCGYAAPSARMQYTGRSFAELIGDRLLPRALSARVSVVAPDELFPRRASLSAEYSDPMTRDFYEPFLTRWADRFSRLRFIQQGKLHVYLVYVLVAALISLAWASIRTWRG